jgi:hypothetical protein
MGSASDGWSYNLYSHSMGEFADNENQAIADAAGRTCPAVSSDVILRWLREVNTGSVRLTLA